MKDMIIDAHHHLWRYNRADYAWMDDSMMELKRDYLPEELETELKEKDVFGTVVVQARQKMAETRWLLEMADQFDFIKGVVGWVDLQSDDLLENLEEVTSHPKMVGVRHVIHDEPDDDFMLRPKFLRGIEKLASNDLTYDLLLFPKHLLNAVQLVKQFPDQKFVLDHIGKPYIRKGILRPWKDDLKALAGQMNVWCKISGMVTEADHRKWMYEDLIPYLDVVVEAFGPDRIMLGSDWPVCRLAGEYGEVLDIPKRYFKSFSKDEKECIFKTNCINFYGLDTN